MATSMTRPARISQLGRNGYRDLTNLSIQNEHTVIGAVVPNTEPIENLGGIPADGEV